MAAGEWLADSGRFGQGGVRVNAGEGRRGGVEALGVRNRKGTRRGRRILASNGNCSSSRAQFGKEEAGREG